MGLGHGSEHGTARLRGLAAELKELRASARLTTRDVAKRVGISSATLNRMENGNRSIPSEDVAALLAIYGVVGVERERILDLARHANLPGWWETTGGGLPKQLPALISFESEAVRMVHAAMLRIPGLLQTPDYIRAVMSSTGVLGASMETMVATRLGRQAVLTRPQPPQYLAIIDEAALRRTIGSVPIMAEQVRHILAMARRPNVDIRIIPFDRGAHTGLDGSYVLLEFAKARPVVHLEHKRQSMFVDEPEDVDPFHDATETLLSVALGPAESVEFLVEVVTDYVRE